MPSTDKIGYGDMTPTKEQSEKASQEFEKFYSESIKKQNERESNKNK